MAAGEDREADDMRLLVCRRRNDLGRGQADALVVEIHAAVAGAGGDLFGAVGMAVKAGLAHQELQAAAEFGGDGIHASRMGSSPSVRFEGLRDAGGRAVFAEGRADDGGPFAGGDARLAAADGGRA